MRRATVEEMTAEFDWWIATMKALGYTGGNEPAFVIIDEVHIFKGETNEI